MMRIFCLLLVFAVTCEAQDSSFFRRRTTVPTASSSSGWTDTNIYNEIYNYGTNTAGLVGNANGGSFLQNPTVATGPAMTIYTNQNGLLNDTWYFDGSDDRLESTNVITCAGSYTVGMWFKLASAGGYLWSIDNDGNHQSHAWYDSANDQILFREYEGAYGSVTQAFTYDTSWHFIACVKSNTSGFVYLDGVVTTGAVTMKNPTPLNKMAVGCLWYATTRSTYMNGTVDCPFYAPTNFSWTALDAIYSNTIPTNSLRSNYR